MNNILGKKIELKKGILGTIVVVLGLLGLLFAPSIISIFSLTITGFIAFTLVFGKKDTKKMFSKPVAPVKNIAKYFGSIIYGTDESELILQPHFHFRY